MKKQEPVRLTLLIVLLMTVLTIISVQLGVVGLAWAGRGDVCAQCGARRDAKSSALQLFFVSIPLSSSKETKAGSLTSLWGKYCGGCRHDWVFNYYNDGGPMRGTRADGFPSFDYPVVGRTEIHQALSNAIERLETPALRATGLRSLGSRYNLLRFAAADALLALDNTNPTEWWSTNSNLFTVETNREAAEKFLNQLESRKENWIEWTVEWSRDLIRKMDKEKR